jgi:hypothetical protein
MMETVCGTVILILRTHWRTGQLCVKCYYRAAGIVINIPTLLTFEKREDWFILWLFKEMWKVMTSIYNKWLRTIYNPGSNPSYFSSFHLRMCLTTTSVTIKQKRKATTVIMVTTVRIVMTTTVFQCGRLSLLGSHPVDIHSLSTRCVTGQAWSLYWTPWNGFPKTGPYKK